MIIDLSKEEMGLLYALCCKESYSFSQMRLNEFNEELKELYAIHENRICILANKLI